MLPHRQQTAYSATTGMSFLDIYLVVLFVALVALLVVKFKS
jgi:hypothetical protein